MEEQGCWLDPTTHVLERRGVRTTMSDRVSYDTMRASFALNGAAYGTESVDGGTWNLCEILITTSRQRQELSTRQQNHGGIDGRSHC